MAEITEIFILKLTDPTAAAPVRARAKADFLALEGVTSWRTFVTSNPDKPQLFAELFTFPDEETAKRVSPQFSERPMTQAYLAQVEETLVGQYFTALPDDLKRAGART